MYFHVIDEDGAVQSGAGVEAVLLVPYAGRSTERLCREAVGRGLRLCGRSGEPSGERRMRKGAEGGGGRWREGRR